MFEGGGEGHTQDVPKWTCSNIITTHTLSPSPFTANDEQQALSHATCQHALCSRPLLRVVLAHTLLCQRTHATRTVKRAPPHDSVQVCFRGLSHY
jgi:hypothetical protein